MVVNKKNKKVSQRSKPLTPIKAIRLHCVDCCAGQLAEVRRCPFTECSLYEYRMGHRPKHVQEDETE